MTINDHIEEIDKILLKDDNIFCLHSNKDDAKVLIKGTRIGLILLVAELLERDETILKIVQLALKTIESETEGDIAK